MIYHYFNCDIRELEGYLNDHAKDGFRLEQMEITGCLVHIIMSIDISEPEQPTKRKYNKAKNDNL